MLSKNPDGSSPLKPIVDLALTKRSYSELDEKAMNLFNLCCLIVDIQLRHKKESAKEFPGQHSLVDLSLEVYQREGSENAR